MPERQSTREPDVLELRIHGVSNTPPAAMLGLRADQVMQVDGDDLGSFWVARPGVDDPHGPPHGVRREAYSWGAMARLSTVPGLGKVSGTIAGVIRALWVLIIPFGFANVAYWSRDLEEPTGRRSSASGGLVRLFGLLLTLLVVTTTATVTLGVVAAQCYTPRATLPGTSVEYVMRCTALPSALDSWARWATGVRTAAYAAVAAGALIVLGVIGSTGLVRYEPRESTTKARGLGARGSARRQRWPVLARPGFWNRAMRSGELWLLHLAASLGALTAMLAWHFLYRDRDDCQVATGFGAKGCFGGTFDAAGRGWSLLVIGGVAVVVGVAVRVTVLRLDPVRPRPPARDEAERLARRAEARAGERRASRWRLLAVLLCALALALFVTCDIAVANTPDGALEGSAGRADVPFVGLDPVPRAIVALLLLLCFVGAGARARVRAWLWAPIVVLAPVAAGTAVLWPDAGAARWLRWAAAALAAVLVVVVLVASVRRRRVAHREGWAGRGPFVFLAIAAGFAMLLSAATVVGVVAWLQGPGAPENAAVPPGVASALATVDANDRLRTPVTVEVPHAAVLVTPHGYSQFAVASVAGLAVFVLVVLTMGARMLAGSRTPIPVVPPAARHEVAGPPGSLASPVTQLGPDEVRAVQRGRHRAAFAQRAEGIVGVLSWILLAALVLALVLPDPTATYGGFVGHAWTFGVQWSTAAVTASVGLLITSVVLAGSKKSLARPWGLLWDLMCFLPRAAHPFAPPCYTERVVPELRSRIDRWLGDDGSPSRPGRSVVLSAHSLGGVIAVAALLARWDGPAGDADPRVALLTYGTQLRAYFGRFFPELFGPAVLGTRSAPAPHVWRLDPWTRAPATPNPPGYTLADSLTTRGRTTRWRSLWRRTDFIGFPVDDYVPTPRQIDHVASEIAPDTYMLAVAAHSGYPETAQYAVQLDVMVDELRALGRLSNRFMPGP
jgi:hypothetical protein